MTFPRKRKARKLGPSDVQPERRPARRPSLDVQPLALWWPCDPAPDGGEGPCASCGEVAGSSGGVVLLVQRPEGPRPVCGGCGESRAFRVVYYRTAAGILRDRELMAWADGRPNPSAHYAAEGQTLGDYFRACALIHPFAVGRKWAELWGAVGSRDQLDDAVEAAILRGDPEPMELLRVFPSARLARALGARGLASRYGAPAVLASRVREVLARGGLLPAYEADLCAALPLFAQKG